MSLDPLLLDVLACPEDKEPLLWFEDEDVLYNPRLHKSYAVVDGVPVLDGVVAWATCELRELIPGGDHTIAIGNVIGLGLGDGEPLLWYAGRYRTLPAR